MYVDINLPFYYSAASCCWPKEENDETILKKLKGKLTIQSIKSIELVWILDFKYILLLLLLLLYYLI